MYYLFTPVYQLFCTRHAPVGMQAGSGFESFEFFNGFFQQGFGRSAATAELFGRVTQVLPL
jgi:hypothetical protein